jgi:Asp-tRNA(Asn)/Glu-tRNA(Gln) amidotransferase B subunit
MAQRGRPKKIISEQPMKLADDTIHVKLDSIQAVLNKNQKDIEELKHQVSMGKGGIKAIFIVGALIAAIGTLLGIFPKGG